MAEGTQPLHPSWEKVIHRHLTMVEGEHIPRPSLFDTSWVKVMKRHEQMTAPDINAHCTSTHCDDYQNDETHNQCDQTEGEILAVVNEEMLAKIEAEIDGADAGMSYNEAPNYDPDFDRVMSRGSADDPATPSRTGEVHLSWEYEQTQPRPTHSYTGTWRHWYAQLLQVVLSLVVEEPRKEQEQNGLSLSWLKPGSGMVQPCVARQHLKNAEHQMSVLSWRNTMLAVLVYMSMQTTCNAETGVS